MSTTGENLQIAQPAALLPHSVPALSRYGKVFPLEHRATKGLLDKPVIVQEKIDGSQISWGVTADGELLIRSKRVAIDPEAPSRMFQGATATIRRLHEAGLLAPGATYRAEALERPRHNTIAYGRIPFGHLMLFDIDAGLQDYASPERLDETADRFGIECVPVLYRGLLSGADDLAPLLERESVLGGARIEGVVIKRSAKHPLFAEDGIAVRAKFVSPAFREAHRLNPEWKRTSQKDLVLTLAQSVSTEARWQKVARAMLYDRTLEGSPRDIGKLIPAIRADIAEECLDDIKDRVWQHFAKRFYAACTRGLPEWYKQKLAEGAFGLGEES